MSTPVATLSEVDGGSFECLACGAAPVFTLDSLTLWMESISQTSLRGVCLVLDIGSLKTLCYADFFFIMAATKYWPWR